MSALRAGGPYGRAAVFGDLFDFTFNAFAHDGSWGWFLFTGDRLDATPSPVQSAGDTCRHVTLAARNFRCYEVAATLLIGRRMFSPLQRGGDAMEGAESGPLLQRGRSLMAWLWDMCSLLRRGRALGYWRAEIFPCQYDALASRDDCTASAPCYDAAGSR